MQKYLVVAVLLVSFAGSVLAAETFYIVFDATLHGCTIATAEPTDKPHYKVLGTYKSEAEAKKAIARRLLGAPRTGRRDRALKARLIATR